MVIQINKQLIKCIIYVCSRRCQIFPVSLIALGEHQNNKHSTFLGKKKPFFEEGVSQGN